MIKVSECAALMFALYGKNDDWNSLQQRIICFIDGDWFDLGFDTKKSQINWLYQFFGVDSNEWVLTYKKKVL